MSYPTVMSLLTVMSSPSVSTLLRNLLPSLSVMTLESEPQPLYTVTMSLRKLLPSSMMSVMMSPISLRKLLPSSMMSPISLRKLLPSSMMSVSLGVPRSPSESLGVLRSPSESLGVPRKTNRQFSRN